MITPTRGLEDDAETGGRGDAEMVVADVSFVELVLVFFAVFLAIIELPVLVFLIFVNRAIPARLLAVSPRLRVGLLALAQREPNLPVKGVEVFCFDRVVTSSRYST